MRFFLCLLAVIFMASCATVIDTPQQNVTILTPGTKDAMCMLKRPGYVYKVRPPETITINKNEEDMVVHCKAQGNRDKTVVVKPEVSSMGLANISNGVVPGVATDFHSGALYKYPDVIAVDFTGMPAMAYDYPAYMNEDTVRPGIYHLEDMGPDTPSIPGDLVNARRLMEAEADYAYEQERESRKAAVGYDDWNK